VDDGVIVARTDSEGASLTQKIPVSKTPGDLADKYNSFLETEEIDTSVKVAEGDILIKQNGKLVRPTRLPNGLYKFRAGTNIARVVLDCVTSLQNGADLLWIETPTPNLENIGAMVRQVRQEVPNAKLVYNNSPSFNWTLNFRQQAYDQLAKSQSMAQYDRASLMDEEYDDTELGRLADQKIRTFQADAAQHAGIFHHLITLPTYHTAALSTDQLAQGYFGEMGMLAYVKGVQRQEIRVGLDCVKHQDMAGTYIGDDHKKYFSGEAALLAGGAKNTMDQFEANSKKRPAANGIKNGVPKMVSNGVSNGASNGVH